MANDNTNLGDDSEEAVIARELADWLPKQGDRLFVTSGSGARLDPLGFTAHCEQRKLTGIWRQLIG